MWNTIKREMKYTLATTLEQTVGKRAGRVIKELRGWTERQLERWKMDHKLRLWVYRQYGKVCLRCGVTEDIQIDHVLPIWQGGKTETWNLQPLCGKCNRWKGTRFIDFRK